MKTLLLAFVFLSSSVFSSAFATEIRLTPGSTITVRAGDQATVSCQGGGGGGDHGRCRCVVGDRNTNSLINCSEGYVGYVVLSNGAPIFKEGCWSANDADSAGRVCLEKIKQSSLCD